MLMNRIIGAFTFRKGVYADVEADTTFTTTAYLIVVVVGILNSLGSSAGGLRQSLLNGVFSLLGTAIFAIVGFVIAAWVISWVGKNFMGAQVDYGEVVRTLGLAYVWNIIGAFGVVEVISPTLSCVTGPLGFIGWIAALVAWFIALKEALDLDWGKTILTAIVGWVVMLIVMLIGGVILAGVGIIAGTALSIFGF